MRKGNPAVLRLFRDQESSTGMSAAILIRNVRPRRINKSGAYLLAESQFNANFHLNCDGEQVRPQARVLIFCHPNAKQSKAILRRRKDERLLARSPMLK